MKNEKILIDEAIETAIEDVAMLGFDKKVIAFYDNKEKLTDYLVPGFDKILNEDYQDLHNKKTIFEVLIMLLNRKHNHKRKIYSLVIEARRLIAGSSKTELAKLLETNYNQILRWESGEYTPNIESAIKLAEISELPLKWFIDNSFIESDVDFKLELTKI